MVYLRSQGIPVSPRGADTLEFPMPVCTTYMNPLERVLFEPKRDANPFFHLMESLWILGGRDDSEFPSQFNQGLLKYSDDGKVFHAAYGHRLRSCGRDQLSLIVDKLKSDHDTRQAVLQIWDFHKDLNVVSKDIPCNCSIFFKIRNDKLNMTVCNRSNDVIWGAYGANVVQFSMIQEYVASMVGIKMGVYNQISDSFHVYTDNPQWEKLKNLPMEINDPYLKGTAKPYSLIEEPSSFDIELQLFLNGEEQMGWDNSFFPEVAIPMFEIWYEHKESKRGFQYLDDIKASDWRLACEQWLARRGDHA
jgi:thymidylate synthase